MGHIAIILHTPDNDEAELTSIRLCGLLMLIVDCMCQQVATISSAQPPDSSPLDMQS